MKIIRPQEKEGRRPAKCLFVRRAEKREKQTAREEAYVARCAELTASIVARRGNIAALQGGGNFI